MWHVQFSTCGLDRGGLLPSCIACRAGPKKFGRWLGRHCCTRGFLTQRGIWSVEAVVLYPLVDLPADEGQLEAPTEAAVGTVRARSAAALLVGLVGLAVAARAAGEGGGGLPLASRGNVAAGRAGGPEREGRSLARVDACLSGLRFGPGEWPSTLSEASWRTRGMGTRPLRGWGLAGLVRARAGADGTELAGLVAFSFGLLRKAFVEHLHFPAPDEQGPARMAEGGGLLLAAEHDEAEAFVLVGVGLLFDHVGVGEARQSREGLLQVEVRSEGVEVPQLDLQLLLAREVLLQVARLEDRLALADPAVEIQRPVDQALRNLR